MTQFRLCRQAFTLIELLVVVAVIVILIAILVPALNQALYMAKLAQCAGNMDGFGTATITYAHANKDRYPNRTVFDLENVQTQGVVTINGDDPAEQTVVNYGGLMGMLKWARHNRSNSAQQPADERADANEYDDRELWGTYVDVSKTFIDPFTFSIDLKHPDSYDPDDLVLASQDILVGWGWKGEGRMEKMGSRATYTVPGNGTPAGAFYSWDILMMDRDLQVPDYQRLNAKANTAVGNVNVAKFWFNADGEYWQPAFTSHPASSGLSMQEQGVEDAFNEEEGSSVWVSQFIAEGPRDNRMDRNFLRSDGSVQTIRDIYAGNGMVLLDNESQYSLAPSKSKFTGNQHAAEDERMVVASANRAKWYGNGTVLMPRK